MADKKISALPAATTPLAGTEVLPIVQSGSTDQVSVANLTAGRNFSGLAYTGYSPDGTKQLVFTPGNAGHQILGDYSSGSNVPIQIGIYTIPAMLKFETTGDITVKNNFIQGTAAKGVNFTANTPAAGMTSQLLNWYEEGTWTPTVTAFSGTITTVGAVSGRYTRIGRQLFISADCTITTNGTGSVQVKIAGMPYSASGSLRFSGCGFEAGVSGKGLAVDYSATGNYLGVVFCDGTYPGANNARLIVSITYDV